MKNKKIELNKTYKSKKDNQKYIVKNVKMNKNTKEAFVELTLEENKTKLIVRPYDLFLSQIYLESEV